MHLALYSHSFSVSKINIQLNRTMIRTHDFRVDLGIHQFFLQTFRDTEIINTPSGIFLPRLETIRPPGIDSFLIRIKIAIGVDKSLSQQCRKFSAFLIRKTGIFSVGFWILQINFFVCHIYCPIVI